MVKSLVTLIGISILSVNSLFSQPKFSKTNYDALKSGYLYVQNNCNLKNGDSALIVDGKNQKLYLTSRKGDSLYVHREYNVSTGVNGFGVEENSCKTPTGIHEITSKMGENVPLGGIFANKKYTGKVAEIHQEVSDFKKDYMTTRLFVLEGREEFNSNTYSRDIFIHGTNKEYDIGRQKSHGCIRMKNKDILELYKLIHEGTYVYIFK